MTFAQQVWWSRAGGAGAAALAFTLTGLVFAFFGGHWAVLLDVALGLLFMAAAFGIMSGIIRPVHRWLWLNTVQPSMLYSDRQKRWAHAGRIGAWWLHLGRAGFDRDSVNG